MIADLENAVVIKRIGMFPLAKALVAACLFLCLSCYGIMNSNTGVKEVSLTPGSARPEKITLGTVDVSRPGKYTYHLDRLPKGVYYLGLLFPFRATESTGRRVTGRVDILLYGLKSSSRMVCYDHLTSNSLRLVLSSPPLQTFVTLDPDEPYLYCPAPMIDLNSTVTGLVIYPEDWTDPGARFRKPEPGDLRFRADGWGSYLFRCKVIRPVQGPPLEVQCCLTTRPDYFELTN